MVKLLRIGGGMFGWNKERLYNKTFIFIAGVEGSGTTMLLEFLSKPSFVAALGGLYFSPGYKSCRKKIISALDYLWDTTETKDSAKIQKNKELIKDIKIPKNITHLIYKRSFPYINILPKGNVVSFPNLSDLFDFAVKAKVVVLERSLKSCVASILRREIATTIDQAAERIKQGRIYLDQGLASIKREDYEVFSYEDFIKKPHTYLDKLETFLEYPKGSLAPFVVSTIKQPTKEAKSILQEHSAFLDQFFSNFSNKVNET